MTPKAAPARLTNTEFLEKMSSPKVEIIVGPETKHYSVPKDVLCYYSSYFDRCFNEHFKEATELKATLPDDNVEDFEILLEYILTGKAPATFSTEDYNKAGMSKCMKFIKYADKYDLGEAAMAVHDDLAKILWQKTKVVKPDHIETVFRVFPPHNLMRQLIAKAALNAGFSGRASYHKEEREIDGIAEEMLNQLRQYTIHEQEYRIATHEDLIAM